MKSVTLKKISDLHLDMLGEIFNMGMGKAISELSKVMGSENEIQFSVPNVQILNKEDFLKSAKNERFIGMILQGYSGDINGNAYIFYPMLTGSELINKLIGTDIPNDQVDKLESDFLTELGNIFINESIKSLSSFTGAKVATTLPQLVYYKVLKDKDKSKDDILFKISSPFSIKEKKVKGEISLLIDDDDVEQLLETIDMALKNMCA